MRRMWLLILGGAALPAAWASVWAASAADAPDAAPEPQTRARIGVYGAPVWRQSDAPGAFPLVRRARPLASPATWVSANDAPIRLAVEEALSGYASVRLDIGPDGRAVGCADDWKSGDARLAQGVCEAVTPRVRLTPAIDEAGTPRPDQFTLTLSFQRVLSAYGDGGGLIVETQPPPAPPPLDAWPPASAPTLASVEGLELIRGDVTLAAGAAATWAGVRLRQGRAGVDCEIADSSGDAAFNREACARARRARITIASQSWSPAIPLLFLRQDGEARAAPPVQRAWTPARALPEAAAAVVTALESDPQGSARLVLSVTVDPQGVATGCEVDGSTGNDRSDVLACRAVKGRKLFEAAVDVFGVRRAGGLWGWRPGATRP